MTWQTIEEALAVEPEAGAAGGGPVSQRVPSDSLTADSLVGGYPLRQSAIEHVLRSSSVRKVPYLWVETRFLHVP